MRNDRQSVHAPVAKGDPNRVASGPQQPVLLSHGQAAGGPRGVYPGAPEDFIG